jgi:hypothetical protein
MDQAAHNRPNADWKQEIFPPIRNLQGDFGGCGHRGRSSLASAFDRLEGNWATFWNDGSDLWRTTIAEVSAAAGPWVPLSSVYGHIERATSHRRDGFMECCENPGFANSRRDLVSVQVGSKVWTDTREDDADPFVGQMIE